MVDDPRVIRCESGEEIFFFFFFVVGFSVDASFLLSVRWSSPSISPSAKTWRSSSFSSSMMGSPSKAFAPMMVALTMASPSEDDEGTGYCEG